MPTADLDYWLVGGTEPRAFEYPGLGYSSSRSFIPDHEVGHSGGYIISLLLHTYVMPWKDEMSREFYKSFLVTNWHINVLPVTIASLVYGLIAAGVTFLAVYLSKRIAVTRAAS